MPFKNLRQSQACFSTHGFGGKVNCKEFADKTNYNSIPKKKSGNDIVKAKKKKQ
jgi:hypothetical protein